MARPVDREKRRDLARRAVDALAELGIDASMTQLADALGVKRPTLLYHFPTKAAIAEQALQDILGEQAERVIARQEAVDHPIDQLMEQIRGVHEYHHGRERRILLLTQMVASAGDDHTDQIMKIGNMVFEARRQVMAQRLREGIEAGIFAPCDVDSLMYLIRCFNDGLIVQRVMLGLDLAPIHRFIWEHVLAPLKIEAEA